MVVNYPMCSGDESLVGCEVIVNALRNRPVGVVRLVQVRDGLSLESDQSFGSVEAVMDDFDNAFEVLQVLHAVVRSL